MRAAQESACGEDALNLSGSRRKLRGGYATNRCEGKTNAVVLRIQKNQREIRIQTSKYQIKISKV